MAGPEANFTDWQQSSRRQGLVVDDDFSWSDAPAPRRRGELAVPSRRAASGTIVIERGDSWDAVRSQDEVREPRRGGIETYMDTRPVSYDDADVHEYDYPQSVADDGYAQDLTRAEVYATHAPAAYGQQDGERRTVVITGRGSEGYQPVRRRETGAIVSKRGFRPDSIAMWAVLLGIALLLGSIAH